MTHYGKEYQNVNIVKCRSPHASRFTVGKEYPVLETRTKVLEPIATDNRPGYTADIIKYTDIYLKNDNGDFVNAAEPTDFEIVS